MQSGRARDAFAQSASRKVPIGELVSPGFRPRLTIASAAHVAAKTAIVVPPAVSRAKNASTAATAWTGTT